MYQKLTTPVLHQNAYHVIDDPILLKTIKQSCYTGNDVRASWIGPGLPCTHSEEYANWALWPLSHWAMYSGFLDLVNQDSKSTLLDVGCGVGYATVCLSSICPDFFIVGIDMDENCIKFANQYNNGESSLSYVAANFLTWNAENSKYDYVFVLDTLEHISSELHYEFVDKCLSMLTEHGLLFITTPNELDVKDASGKHGHIGLLNKERALKFISQYAKNIVEANFYNNKELASLDPTKYTIKDSIETFDAVDDKNRSHFKLVMRKNPCGEILCHHIL